MSRSGYSDDCWDDPEGQWALIRWRGAVKAATKGKRGQAMLVELRDALDAMPDKKLVAWELEKDGQVCVLGALGQKRGVDMTKLDPQNAKDVAKAFGIARALAKEIVYENDEVGYDKTPEARWQRMRAWVDAQIAEIA